LAMILCGVMAGNKVSMEKCTVASLLEGRSIKLTKQRKVVLESILKRNEPFCASDLYESIEYNIDLATIYRNLEMFSTEGILRRVANENDRQYYELACIHNPPHPHFLCSRCGKIYCLKNISTLKKIKKILPDGFSTEQTLLQFKGLCPKCN